MLCAGILSFVVLSLAGLPVCFAGVSMIVPGFDSQPPLSVSIVGVGAGGETTYLMYPGRPTGTEAAKDPAFIGTVTVVEGADNAVFEYANSALSVTVTESCTLANGKADCLAAFPGHTTISTEVPVTPILVPGGGTASPAPTGAANSAIPVQTAAASQSVASPLRPPPPPPTQSLPSPKPASSGVRLTPAKVAGLAGMLAIWAVLT